MKLATWIPVSTHTSCTDELPTVVCTLSGQEIACILHRDSIIDRDWRQYNFQTSTLYSCTVCMIYDLVQFMISKNIIILNLKTINNSDSN